MLQKSVSSVSFAFLEATGRFSTLFPCCLWNAEWWLSSCDADGLHMKDISGKVCHWVGVESLSYAWCNADKGIEFWS
jgi:hypothetical protein